MKNYQEVLLKIYFDAGLNGLAVDSKYLPKSIGTNFTQTHLFLLEVWESIFCTLMRFYLEAEAPENFLQEVSDMVKNSPPSELQESALRNLKEMLGEISDKSKDMCRFRIFVDTHSKQNQTLRFWSQFLSQDCLAYIALFLAIRSGNWNLRIAAFKLMAPLFTEFDRPKYSKLIPHHFLGMHTIPDMVLAHLKRGGFTVSILGRACHSIGVNEAHKMCINRECKEFIIRPSADYISRTAAFLPVRSKAIPNLEQQIFADRKSPTVEKITSLHTTDPECMKHNSNVQSQIQKLNTDSVSFPKFHASNLQHLFNSKAITPQQSHDLMNFREIGQIEYQRNIDYYILYTEASKTQNVVTHIY